jgi:hypothetical protein
MTEDDLTGEVVARRESDTVVGVKESLIEDFVPGVDGVLVCEHDFVLRRAAGPGATPG